MAYTLTHIDDDGVWWEDPKHAKTNAFALKVVMATQLPARALPLFANQMNYHCLHTHPSKIGDVLEGLGSVGSSRGQTSVSSSLFGGAMHVYICFARVMTFLRFMFDIRIRPLLLKEQTKVWENIAEKIFGLCVGWRPCLGQSRVSRLPKTLLSGTSLSSVTDILPK